MFGHSKILRTGVAAWAHSTLRGPSGAMWVWRSLGCQAAELPSSGLCTFRRSVGMKDVEVETCNVLQVRVYHVMQDAQLP